MVTSVQQRVSMSRQLLQTEFFLLDSLSPFAVLRRGYSITIRATTKEIIKNAAQVCTGEEIEIRLGEGRLFGQVKKTSPAS
jgi:exodeoxyribonuclease VII large subunit